jgi:putative flippase GtrA
VPSITGGVPSVSLTSAATAPEAVSVPAPAVPPEAAADDVAAEADGAPESAGRADRADGGSVESAAREQDDPPVEPVAAEPAPDPRPASEPEPGSKSGTPRWIAAAPPWIRYAAGSLIATVLSQIALTVAYGLLGASAVVASIAAFFAGTIPNYYLNKAWAWSGHKLSQRRLIVSYLAVIGVTNVAAIVMTVTADSMVRAHVQSDGLRTGLLDLSYLASNLLMFVVKVLLFDGVLFKPRQGADSEAA